MVIYNITLIYTHIKNNFLFIPECVGKKLDIFFIIDKSASIDGKEISLQENCTRTIINGLDIGKAFQIYLEIYNLQAYQKLHIFL